MLVGFILLVAMPLIIFAHATNRIELKRLMFFTTFRLFLWCFGARVRQHGKKPRMDSKEHLFVSNHTSLVDYILLSALDYPMATVAQIHGGLFGKTQFSFHVVLF